MCLVNCKEKVLLKDTIVYKVFGVISDGRRVFPFKNHSREDAVYVCTHEHPNAFFGYHCFTSAKSAHVYAKKILNSAYTIRCNLVVIKLLVPKGTAFVKGNIPSGYFGEGMTAYRAFVLREINPEGGENVKNR